MFADRRDAGRKLGEAVAQLELEQPLVLALPRGGVPVAFEVARRLGAPLDVLLVRKLGTPGQRELAMGAIVGGASPQVVFNDEIIASGRISPTIIDAEIVKQRAELERRRLAYGRAELPVMGRNIVLVDDGVATGASARAALMGLRQAGAAKLLLAVPVGPQDALAALGTLADDVVCLLTPDRFLAVGEWYRDFTQTRDDEVMALLAEAAS